MLEHSWQPLANLRARLNTADIEVTDVVKWTIFYIDGGDVQEGVAAFGEF